jgi:hypothetical protein
MAKPFSNVIAEVVRQPVKGGCPNKKAGQESWQNDRRQHVGVL